MTFLIRRKRMATVTTLLCPKYRANIVRNGKFPFIAMFLKMAWVCRLIYQTKPYCSNFPVTVITSPKKIDLMRRGFGLGWHICERRNFICELHAIKVTVRAGGRWRVLAHTIKEDNS